MLFYQNNVKKYNKRLKKPFLNINVFSTALWKSVWNLWKKAVLCVCKGVLILLIPYKPLQVLWSKRAYTKKRILSRIKSPRPHKISTPRVTKSPHIPHQNPPVPHKYPQGLDNDPIASYNTYSNTHGAHLCRLRILRLRSSVIGSH
jgi:hypothetical protein